MDAIIEIPEGSDRRIHFNKETRTFIDFGPIQEKIPVHDGIMPVAYGFIKNTLNKIEGDEVDVLILSKRHLKTGDQIEVFPVAILLREDRDDKVVATDETLLSSVHAWRDIDQDLKTLLLEYFGHNHKITSIEDKESALLYISQNTL